MSLQLACGLPRRRPTPSYIRVYIGYVEKRPAKVGQVWLSWYSVRSLVLCPFATHPHCKISSNSCLRHSSTLVSLSSRGGNFHCSTFGGSDLLAYVSASTQATRSIRQCESQTACCRSCRGHSKAGPQVAEQQHVETVARQGVTPRALPKGCCKMSLPIPKQQDTYVALRATTRRLGNKSSASGQRRETQQSSISKTGRD